MYSISERLKQAAEKQKQHVPRSVAMQIFLVILLVICFKWFDFLEANQIKNKFFFSTGKSNQIFFFLFKVPNQKSRKITKLIWFDLIWIVKSRTLDMINIINL